MEASWEIEGISCLLPETPVQNSSHATLLPQFSVTQLDGKLLHKLAMGRDMPKDSFKHNQTLNLGVRLSWNISSPGDPLGNFLSLKEILDVFAYSFESTNIFEALSSRNEGVPWAIDRWICQ